MKRWLALGAALVTAMVTVTGCGSNPLQTGQGSAIVVGSADFSESELLMDIYADALRDTGANVQTKPNIGAREVYVDALRRGELTVVPEYTGDLLEYLNPKAQDTESLPVYNDLKAALPSNLQVLNQSSAQDSDVLAVTAATAATGVHSMTDLGPRCGNLVLGAPAEWPSRWKAKIAQLYGCQFKEIRGLEAGQVTVNALVANQIQAADLFTTSSDIKTHNLVPLADPKHMFPAQNVVPLVLRNKLTPAQTAALNRVSAALTTDKLLELNRQLDVNKANPADLATQFVAQIGR